MLGKKLSSLVVFGAVVLVFAPRCGGSTSTDDGGVDGNTPSDSSVTPDTNTPNDASPANDSSLPTSDGSSPNDAGGPPCTTDQNCAQPTPYCDAEDDQCVQCLSDTNC